MPSEPQMYDAGRTGVRKSKKAHESYFKNGTFEELSKRYVNGQTA